MVMPTVYGDDEPVTAAESESELVSEENSVQVVRHLSVKYFRCKLIEHFDILFKRHELVWPTHRK